MRFPVLCCLFACFRLIQMPEYPTRGSDILGIPIFKRKVDFSSDLDETSMGGHQNFLCSINLNSLARKESECQLKSAASQPIQITSTSIGASLPLNARCPPHHKSPFSSAMQASSFWTTLYISQWTRIIFQTRCDVTNPVLRIWV